MEVLTVQTTSNLTNERECAGITHKCRTSHRHVLACIHKRWGPIIAQESKQCMERLRLEAVRVQTMNMVSFFDQREAVEEPL